jgi:septum formation protein
MTLVLASASPRRQELLKNAGIEFVVRPANIQEIRQSSETPEEFAERMARDKAMAVWDNAVHSHTQQNARKALAADDAGLKDPTSRKPREVGHPYDPSQRFALGADTIVVVGNEVLGKPADADDAARMLRLVSGRAHSVITGVCLVGDRFEDVRSETTTVHFSVLTEPEITSYVESGEPMDKAGAYAIQGIASQWISKIEGDYNNVVGLPVDLVLRMLCEHGAAG